MVKFNNMKTVELQALPAPPSLMAALKAGFDAVANHISLIVFPVMLDIYLWLGPRLSLSKFIEQFMASWASVLGEELAEGGELLTLTGEFWLFVAKRLNLFTLLRSYPVGVPSLMASRQPVETPLGAPLTWQITSTWQTLGSWLALSLLGLVIGALYYSLVAQAAIQGEVDWRQALSHWPWAASQVIVLAFFWVLLILALSVPGSFFISIVTLIGLPLGQLSVFLFAGLVLWVIFPLLFSPHGIFVHQARMWVSVKDSLRLTRFTMVHTAMLFATLFIISEGLEMLWGVPEDASWVTLLGLLGHAFITTAVLATSFVYYRDADRWVQRLIQQWKLSSQA